MIVCNINTKSVRFHGWFDFLRSSTTLLVQTYTRKTHANNVSVHKTVLELIMISKSVEVSENQVGFITLYCGAR